MLGLPTGLAQTTEPGVCESIQDFHRKLSWPVDYTAKVGNWLSQSGDLAGDMRGMEMLATKPLESVQADGWAEVGERGVGRGGMDQPVDLDRDVRSADRDRADDRHRDDRHRGD